MTGSKFAIFGTPILAAGALMTACVAGKPPFQIVQICLGSDENLRAFIREMQSIAETERMAFRDDSARTQQQLTVLDPDGTVHDVEDVVISVSVESADGMGVTAANLGLPGYQVALGFTEGSRPSDAHAFARRALRKLSRHWQLITLPPNVGAQPLPNCVDRDRS